MTDASPASPGAATASLGQLWPCMRFLERGWLSANNIVFTRGQVAVVDTGYCSQAAQTLEGVQAALAGAPLQRIVNTHLHSDHCGGNAALQAAYPQAQTWIAPGQWAQVQDWDPVALSYAPTGQDCPQFHAEQRLQPGSTIMLGEHAWHIHAAPGHDPHSVILFEPERRLLISADALWQRGFGVVFPEIEGQQAFAQVAATLDVIEQLQPALVLPGHGSMFTDVAQALAVARQRLAAFVADPQRHARYAAKVLLKYKFLEWGQASAAHAQRWCAATALMQLLQTQYWPALDSDAWTLELLAELVASGALSQNGQQFFDK